MILIVDDYQPFRNTLKKWLNSPFPALPVLEAATGEEALTQAKIHRPGIVLMDIILPDMNGIEATRKIKAMLPDTHVIILSYHESERYQADAASAGIDGYIAKRQMHEELLPILQTLLSPPAPRPPDL
jgi:DNA-binding NarL/FixJ family response regulator